MTQTVKNLPAKKKQKNKKKESACNAGNPDSIPGSGRSPGKGNGHPLQYLAWRIPWTEQPRGVAESDTNEQLMLSHSLSISTQALFPYFK